MRLICQEEWDDESYRKTGNDRFIGISDGLGKVHWHDRRLEMEEVKPPWRAKCYPEDYEIVREAYLLWKSTKETI